MGKHVKKHAAQLRKKRKLIQREKKLLHTSHCSRTSSSRRDALSGIETLKSSEPTSTSSSSALSGIETLKSSESTSTSSSSALSGIETLKSSESTSSSSALSGIETLKSSESTSSSSSSALSGIETLKSSESTSSSTRRNISSTKSAQACMCFTKNCIQINNYCKYRNIFNDPLYIGFVERNVLKRRLRQIKSSSFKK